MPIADSSVSQDEAVTFVGFGERENGKAGRKFVGTNQIAGEEETYSLSVVRKVVTTSLERNP